MEYFPRVFSISLGKSETPYYTLKWEGGAVHLLGKETAAESSAHNCLKDCCSKFFFFQLHLVTPPNKTHIFFFKVLRMVCFRC